MKSLNTEKVVTFTILYYILNGGFQGKLVNNLGKNYNPYKIEVHIIILLINLFKIKIMNKKKS